MMEHEILEIESELQASTARIAELSARLEAAKAEAHGTAIFMIAEMIQRNGLDYKAVVAAISPPKRTRAKRADANETEQAEPVKLAAVAK